MLQEALHEAFGGDATSLVFACIGRAVLEGYLSILHAVRWGKSEQTSVGDRDAVNIRCQIFESSFAIADSFAMHDPILLPDFVRDIDVKGSFFQCVLEGGAEQFGKCLNWQEEVFS